MSRREREEGGADALPSNGARGASEEREGVDFCAALPRDLRRLLAEYLRAADIYHLCLVSRAWRKAFGEDGIWTTRFRKRFSTPTCVARLRMERTNGEVSAMALFATRVKMEALFGEGRIKDCEGKTLAEEHRFKCDLLLRDCRSGEDDWRRLEQLIAAEEMEGEGAHPARRFWEPFWLTYQRQRFWAERARFLRKKCPSLQGVIDSLCFLRTANDWTEIDVGKDEKWSEWGWEVVAWKSVAFALWVEESKTWFYCHFSDKWERRARRFPFWCNPVQSSVSTSCEDAQYVQLSERQETAGPADLLLNGYSDEEAEAMNRLFVLAVSCRPADKEMLAAVERGAVWPPGVPRDFNPPQDPDSEEPQEDEEVDEEEEEEEEQSS